MYCHTQNSRIQRCYYNPAVAQRRHPEHPQREHPHPDHHSQREHPLKLSRIPGKHGGPMQGFDNAALEASNRDLSANPDDSSPPDHRRKKEQDTNLGRNGSGKGVPINYAVYIQGLRVCYGVGKKAADILKGINLTLPEGKIYGLLGPSGCGKTTLLRCIVGRLSPSYGDVIVFGKVPGEKTSCIPGAGIGYMPQELTLYPEFTIGETLTFFGRLARMDSDLIKERVTFLVKFLDLPDASRMVRSLSGGQQRRVSLAAALIHRPPLLILDEPTVGVDPLLRQNIWRYLVTLTNDDGLTIIVTTHYIEEARQANIVGLMRGGRMLAQDEPDILMKQYQQTTLEDVFLILCLADKRSGTNDKQHVIPTGISTEDARMLNLKNSYETKYDISAITKNADNYTSPTSHHVYNEKPQFRKSLPEVDPVKDGWARTRALVRKNLTRLTRNLPVLLFSFFVPSFQVILFCVCIGADPFELPMAIVNLDQHPILSQPFLESLNNQTIIQEFYPSLDDGLKAVEDAKAWGLIEFGENFSTALQYRFLLGLESDNDTIEQSSINIYMDMTNQQIGFMIQKSIYEGFLKFVNTMLTRLGRNPLLAQPPIVIKTPIYGDEAPTFTEFMAPGIILSITYIMAVGLTSVSIILERKEGTMERTFVSGVRPIEVVVSHVVSQCLIMVGQVGMLLFFMFVIFDISLNGSFFLVLGLALLQGLSGMTFGLLISSVCSEENSAIMLALASFYPNILLSGIIWPIQSMPQWIRYLSYGLPQTTPTEALRCIMYRGWGIDRQEVWLGYLMSVAWSVFFIIVSTVAFRTKN